MTEVQLSEAVQSSESGDRHEANLVVLQAQLLELMVLSEAVGRKCSQEVPLQGQHSEDFTAKGFVELSLW